MRENKGFKFYLLLGLVLLGATSTLSASELADGYYIKINGGSVPQDSYQKMVVTPNENCSMGSENLLDAYIYLPSGAQGFSIVQVSQGVKKSFQPSANVQQVNSWLYYEPQPQLNFLRGQFEEGASPFTITESGLFYVAIEINTRWMTCIPIKNWNILGTAITGGWEPSNLTLLSPTFSADKKSAVFAIDSITIKPGFYKFRFTNGWKITVDSISENECWNKGSKVNTNFGGSPDNLILGGENIYTSNRGIYNVKLFWEVGKSLKASLVKVKDLDIIDYSSYKIGILGDAYKFANGKQANWENNWGEGKETNVPQRFGHVYTWTFNGIALTNGKEFKIRQGYDWMGLAIDFQDVKKWGGNAKDDFRNMDSKFFVSNSGEEVYDIQLQIDALTEEVSIVVNKH